MLKRSSSLACHELPAFLIFHTNEFERALLLNDEVWDIFTSKYVNIYCNCLADAGWARVGPRVGRLGMLDHQEAGGYVAFLGDHTHPAARGIIWNNLKIEGTFEHMKFLAGFYEHLLRRCASRRCKKVALDYLWWCKSSSWCCLPSGECLDHP